MKFLVALFAFVAVSTAAPQQLVEVEKQPLQQQVAATLEQAVTAAPIDAAALPETTTAAAAEKAFGPQARFLQQPQILDYQQQQYFAAHPELRYKSAFEQRYISQPQLFAGKDTAEYLRLHPEQRYLNQQQLFAGKDTAEYLRLHPEQRYLNQHQLFASKDTAEYLRLHPEQRYLNQQQLFAGKDTAEYLRLHPEQRYLNQQQLFAGKDTAEYLRLHPEQRYLNQHQLFAGKDTAEYLRTHPGYRSQEGVAAIVEQENRMPEPGHYQFRYRTENGIEVAEQAEPKSAGPESAESVQGEYSWVAPNGEKFTIQYVADETGFHPRGAHIPEIPAAIARSLEWNAAHPEQDPEAQSRQYYEQQQAYDRQVYDRQFHDRQYYNTPQYRQQPYFNKN